MDENRKKEDNLTVKEWYNLLTIRLENAPREASRFYNLQLLPRLMHQLQKYSVNCEICKDNFDNLDKDTKHIVTWFKNEGEELKKYQHTIESSLKHLQTNHYVYAKGLWLSRVIVISLLIGLGLGYISHYALPNNDKKGLILLGSMLGVLIGWIVGKLYEKKLRKENKLF